MSSEDVRLRGRSREQHDFRTAQYSMSLRSKEKVPCTSILLAIALFTVGTVLLVLDSLLVTGTIIPAEYADRTIPVLVLGVIAFLPGSYHTYLAWCAYRRYDVFNIPSEALTVIGIDTKTTTHLPIIDIAPGDIWTTHKEFGVQLGEVCFS
ncbi:TMEM230 [Bugula neritina]|uniref:Transmembrane protein 230 n=1 Tax=Bugula neritina TaxID=10212 RepID=A0A7J7JM50_BUGNE|nr:TMEM230 [Bugula neritina]